MIENSILNNQLVIQRPVIISSLKQATSRDHYNQNQPQRTIWEYQRTDDRHVTLLEFLKVNVYRRYIFLPVWRIKSYFIYPIIFQLGKFKGLFSNLFPPRLIKNAPKDNLEGLKHDYKLKVGFTDLPPEIWRIIIGKTDRKDYHNLMITDKRFLDLVAPLIYKDIFINTSITKTTKMKNSDDTYPRYGPDLPNICKGNHYDIFKRSKESSSFEYEIVGTKIDQKSFNEMFDVLFYQEPNETHSEYVDNYSPVIINQYEKIIFIIKNIMLNPNSVMKKHIKNFFIDISIFDGFLELILKPEAPFIKKIKSFDNDTKKSCHLSASTFEELWVYPLWDVFSRCKWTYPTRFHSNILSYHDEMIQKFPQQVYYKEFAVQGILNYFYGTNYERRRSLLNVSKCDELTSLNPFRL
ncbi:hypothetical protein BN7_5479 [Wickerhamomyces ciferrii]|uniref:F-box domain-containing protein n=1 Tax=Wickerhamomyces ciferrii (strain ATCC 14091 / BCRC 22168 / CBS 111 / JCM 3599 / NBRC 0793 / NRRL Y-1031 F-60-10) TaxID=1206466 RepID=K0KVF0_WICCF|nr:uncharacterized protein BN7_5479 [Wickerhamomyces ciferrii]CCH45892.1 hypothetical protein BN7_5479 [Wickerhamomyces ciferrii]